MNQKRSSMLMDKELEVATEVVVVVETTEEEVDITTSTSSRKVRHLMVDKLLTLETTIEVVGEVTAAKLT